jgi:N-acetyl-alpha-D-muramate 1-phosphate uridylyltransferase
MILAAGRGERMRPLTDDLPKPLLAAGGSPLIVWHLRRLARAGIRDIVINHAWLGEKIEERLGDGADFGVRIRYSAEGIALETAGGITRALPLLTSVAPQAGRVPREVTDEAPRDPMPFLVISGDTFCDFDYARAHTIALQMHHARLACWCVMVSNPPHHGGGDFRLADGLLAGTDNGDRLTYSGIGLYAPSMFDAVVPGQKSPLRPWLEREIAAGRAAGEYHDGLWFDIGTAERLAELDRLLESRSINVGV